MSPLNCTRDATDLKLRSDLLIEITTDTLPQRIEQTLVRVRVFRYKLPWKNDQLDLKWLVWKEYPEFDTAPLLLGIAHSMDDAFDRVLFNSCLSSEDTIYLIPHWEDTRQSTKPKP